ncbi:MAG: hypothetical protein KatS3mg011_1266 [Acidimicrobiia bacterium]|nr:MAG: hypothetical protein KatS3mg011_1266 [Acidimicrobiia bacterium]
MQTTRWRARPRTAFAVRVVVFVLPILVGMAAGTGLARLLRPPTNVWEVAGWWLLVIVVASTVATLVDRWVRRALPLAALFELTLTFPDRVPSRFKVALRAGSVSRLRDRVDRMRRGRRGGDGRGCRADPRPGGGALPPRPSNSGPFRANARLCRPDRPRDGSGRRRPGSSPMGGSPPRRRQAVHPLRDPVQEHESRRCGMGAGPHTPRSRYGVDQTDRGMAGTVGQDGGAPSRTVGRFGLPPRTARARTSPSAHGSWRSPTPTTS